MLHNLNWLFYFKGKKIKNKMKNSMKFMVMKSKFKGNKVVNKVGS